VDLRRTAALLAFVALVAACDRPGIEQATASPRPSPETRNGQSPLPDPRVLTEVFSDLGHDLPVNAGAAITDAALIVSVNSVDHVRLVAVHPQIDGVVDGEVTVLGTYVRPIALDGFGAPYGIQVGFPPAVAPGDLLPVGGTVLSRREFPPLSYEIMIGLSIKTGTAHVSAVSVDYQGNDGVATLTFRQDLTICVARPGATSCRGR
jgi:hypothetical protein